MQRSPPSDRIKKPSNLVLLNADLNAEVIDDL